MNNGVAADQREFGVKMDLDDQNDMEIVHISQRGRWVAAGVLLVVLGALGASMLNNPNLRLNVVAEYLFAEPILRGVLVTLQLTFMAMVIGLVGGVLLAIMKLSSNPVLAAVSSVYVWFFRGSPILVQLLFWGYLGIFYEDLILGIPFTDVVAYSVPTADLVSPFIAALLGLSLNEAAYASEIVRGGILAVSQGQHEAGSALGMTRAQIMRTIVMPQAMKVILPPYGNATILMLKTTSLVSVIGGLDLLTRAQHIYAQNFEVIPLLIVVTIWYLAMTSVLSVGQRQLERRFGRGTSMPPARRGRGPRNQASAVPIRPIEGEMA